MKNLYKLAFCLILSTLIISCVNHDERKVLNKKYILTYIVYYPNYPDTVTVMNNDGYGWFSNNGTNTIISKSSNDYLYDNTAPFKILYYEEQELK